MPTTPRFLRPWSRRRRVVSVVPRQTCKAGRLRSQPHGLLRTARLCRRLVCRSRTAVTLCRRRNKLMQDQMKDATQFRDGGDFTVPGSSGVDSRQIQLAVSPGETISVRTPQQKQAAQDQLNAGRKTLQTPVVNVNIQATDANSFSKSQAQTISALKRPA